MTTTYWAKACSCEAGSRTHQFRMVPVPYEEHGIRNTVVTRCTYYPQPSCDKCGTPWREEIRGSTA